MNFTFKNLHKYFDFNIIFKKLLIMIFYRYVLEQWDSTKNIQKKHITETDCVSMKSLIFLIPRFKHRQLTVINYFCVSRYVPEIIKSYGINLWKKNYDE
jgi:hypothetical protein